MCSPFSSRAVSDRYCQPLEDRSMFAIQAFLTLVPMKTTAFPPGFEPGRIVVELTSYRFGVTSPSTIGSATGGTAVGKPVFSKLQVTKLGDDVDPMLLMNIGQGRLFSSARLNIMQTSSTAKKTKMMEYRFSTVAITGLHIAGNADAMDPTDEVEFACRSFDIVNTKKPLTALKRLRKAARD